MEHSCIRQTALPNTTKLFADFIYHPDRVSSFYPYLPLDQDSFCKAADQICFPNEQRERLVAALRVQNPDNPLLEKLARPETVAVVTGQQVGLFSGPPYTIYKALTAIRVAEHLDQQGIPAVPIFWLATEDHDFHEVNQAWVFDAGRNPIELSAGAHPRPGQPVGGVELQSVPLDELRTALSGLRFGDEAYELARDTYQPGVTFGAAFGQLLQRLLTGFPILQVDPMLPAFRQLAAPLLREAVWQTPDLIQKVLARNQSLAEAGYHAQVHIETSTSLFFLLDNGQRLALRRQGDKYVAGSRTFTAAELADRAEDLSPNALLRPVVQDSMMPTICYVGGPAELAYLAQSEVIYRTLLGRQPIALHRAGFTLIDYHTEKLLGRYNLELPDFFHGAESVRERAAKTLVDPELAARIADARGAASTSRDRMAADIEKFDPSIAQALSRSWRKISYQFEKIERKVAREALARHTRAAQDVHALNGLLFPHHKLQERLYSSLAMIAHFGPDLAELVYQHVLLECPDHQMLSV